MSKERAKLQNNRSALELMLSENNDLCTDYKAQISVIDQELEDLGKPKVTPEFLDKIFETINGAIENIDLDDKSISYDLEMDYNNTVTVNNVCFEDTHGVTELIYNKVVQLFAENIEKEEKQAVCAPGSIEKFN